MTLYKWLNGQEATHVPEFRYRLNVWTPPVEGPLIPCENGYHLMREKDLPEWIACDLFVAEYDGELRESNDKVVVRRCRIVKHLTGWNERTQRLFATDCAKRALRRERKQGREPDPRTWEAARVARRYANGKATKEELSAAYSAARSAADSAADSATDAAYAAAYSAAYSAARSAADSAARSAAYEAYSAANLAYSAYSAAGSAERGWQSKRILEYATGRRG